MISILKYNKLFEKTSLLNLGVPYSVMKNIQLNYEISPDAEWGAIKHKKYILSILEEKNNIIILICDDIILLLFSYEKKYYLETYVLTEKDDFGYENWNYVDRKEYSTLELVDLISNINDECILYKLKNGEWKKEFSNIRKLRKSEIEFDEITNNFKISFAENFTRIVKKLYGNKYNVVTNMIINHLKNIKNDISDDEIRNALFLNVERVKEADILKNKSLEKDPYKLKNNYIKDNSLTFFNEYIIEFEDKYSDKYKEYLNIPIMIKKFTREKVMTSFMYYLYSGKLMRL